jgi:hypothetical protein
MTLSVKDSEGDDRLLATRYLDGEHTPFHMEDAAQRAVLLAKLDETNARAVIGEKADTAWTSGAGSVIAVLKAIFGRLADGTAKVVASLSADQDPVFDHAAGTKTTVTASATILTPPAGCKFARFSSNVDCFIRTDNTTAADDAASVPLYAGQPEVLPVTPGVIVKAFAASSAVVRAMPLKARA